MKITLCSIHVSLELVTNFSPVDSLEFLPLLWVFKKTWGSELSAWVCEYERWSYIKRTIRLIWFATTRITEKIGSPSPLISLSSRVQYTETYTHATRDTWTGGLQSSYPTLAPVMYNMFRSPGPTDGIERSHEVIKNSSSLLTRRRNFWQTSSHHSLSVKDDPMCWWQAFDFSTVSL